MKRKKERPVESLRTTWTSTADLEETLSGMFPAQAPPGVVAPREVSTPVVESPAQDTVVTRKWEGGPVDSGRVETIEPVPSPTENAPAADRLFLSRTKKRLFRLARPSDAHTDGENRLYTFLWNEGKDHAPMVRLYAGSMSTLAAAMGREDRNTRPLVESLIRKLSIQIAREQDYRTRQPRIYYVFHPSEIEARRRQAGLVWALKNKGIQLLTEAEAAVLAAEQAEPAPIDLTGVELAPLETILK